MPLASPSLQTVCLSCTTFISSLLVVAASFSSPPDQLSRQQQQQQQLSIDPQLNCHQMLSSAYRFKNVIQIANCRKRGFDTVPSFLDSKTIMLDLKSNRIKRLFQQSFENYPNLVVLFLDGNEIAEITSNTFVQSTKLEVLTLRDNFITLVPALVPKAAFLPLTNLLTLNLDNNPLGKIPDYFFAGLRSLRHLYLNGSGALELGAKSLAQMHNLSTLDLTACKLSTLHHEMEKAFNNMTLNRLNLANNPWMCDCRIKWLVRWFKMQPKLVETNYAGGLAVDQPLCAGPTDSGPVQKSMLDAPIFEKATEMRNFACVPKPYFRTTPSQTQPNNKEFWAYKNDNVTLICEFESDPKGHTEWFKDESKVLPHWPRFSSSQTGGLIFKTTLYITNVESTDAADYRCAHQNVRGKSDQIQQLRVRPKSYNFETMKVLIIILSIAALVIVMLTTLTVFIYCFYCRAYGRSIGHSRGVKQVCGQQRAMSAADNESKSTNNFKNTPQREAVNFVNTTRLSVEHCNTSVLNEQQTHLVRKQVLLTSFNGDITSCVAPINAELHLNGGPSSSTSLSPTTTQFNGYDNSPNKFSHDALDPLAAAVNQQGCSTTVVHACPVHGSRSKPMHSSCPVHGNSRSGTPHEHQTQGTTSSNLYNTLPTASTTEQDHTGVVSDYQRCPLHGDWLRYASLPTAAKTPNLRNKLNMAVANSPSHVQQLQQQPIHLHHHPYHQHHPHPKQSVSFAEPEHLEQSSCSPLSSNETSSNSQIRSTKVADHVLIKRESPALSNVSCSSASGLVVVELPAVAHHVLPAKLVDDEGYSTAV